MSKMQNPVVIFPAWHCPCEANNLQAASSAAIRVPFFFFRSPGSGGEGGEVKQHTVQSNQRDVRDVSFTWVDGWLTEEPAHTT